MLDEYKMPQRFWIDAIDTACHIITRVYLHKFFKKTAYELLTDKKPNMNQHLRILSSSRPLRMSFLLKNLLKNSFQNVMNVELAYLKKTMLRKMLLKKMRIKFLEDNPLILVLQMKYKSRRSSMTFVHQVLSHTQKLHTYLTFVGNSLLSLSQSPLR